MKLFDNFVGDYGFLVLLACCAEKLIPLFALVMVIGSLAGWPGYDMLRGGRISLVVAAAVFLITGAPWLLVVGVVVTAGLAWGGMDGKEIERLHPSEYNARRRVRFTPVD